MKKATFYTLMRTWYGDPYAVAVNGYTDADTQTSYYKSGRTWFAIDNQTGYAIANADTLRQAHARAIQKDRQDALQKTIKQRPYLVTQFSNAVKIARQGASA